MASRLTSVLSRGWLVALLVLTALVITGPSTDAQNLVQGFKSKGNLSPGLIAAISKESSKFVEIAPGGESKRIYGVVIDPSEAALTVADEGEDVFVATSGRYPVLVSVENGSITSGDYVSISSTDGIGARALPHQSFVLGRALDSFDGSSGVLLRTKGGHAVGRISVVDISAGRNPLVRDDIAVLGPLRDISEGIAGKDVSALRLYAALAILLGTVVIGVSLLWVGIRNGMIAIGRNPLSRRSILGSLTQVLVVAVLIFVIGVFGVYLLLKL